MDARAREDVGYYRVVLLSARRVQYGRVGVSESTRARGSETCDWHVSGASSRQWEVLGWWVGSRGLQRRRHAAPDRKSETCMSIDTVPLHRQATRKKQKPTRECLARTVSAASSDMPGSRQCCSLGLRTAPEMPHRFHTHEALVVLACSCRWADGGGVHYLSRERKARAQGMILHPGPASKLRICS